MSRFDHARRASIAVWTGATVIWATTLVAIGVSEGPPPAQPATPASGLTVLRASGTAGPSAATDVAAELPAAETTTPSPPQPVSSGS